VIETNRTMEQARRDFAAGRLKEAMLIRVPMSKSEWTLRLAGSKGDAGMLLDVKTLQPKIFTKLDQAVQALEDIGFAVERLHCA
jgi:hypothetical protein